MAIATAEPIQKSVRWWPFSNPINSVGKSVVAGFALLVLILVAVVVGSSGMVRTYQSDTERMMQQANIASLLQDAQTNGSVSALLTQRYIAAGGDNYPAEIIGSADAARARYVEARARAVEIGDQEQIATLDAFLITDDYLSNDETGARRMIALRESGDIAGAAAVMEEAVPVFRQMRLDVTAANQAALQSVADLESRANRAGDLALLLLVVSGIAGAALAVFVSFLIARSIIRPLSSLEATAREVAKGGLDARAAATGPRELAHLGDTMNYMMDTIQAHTEEIEERGRQLLDARAQAASDPLTGLGNHRKFHEKIRDVVAAAQTNETPVGLIMLDVDNFKAVNDTLGHQAGDRVLRELSATIAEVASHEEGYRYGGDEFTVLLPSCDQHKTSEIAENLLHAVERRIVDGDHAEVVTVSVGVATFPDMAETAQELIYRADMALNWAKSAGKNRLGVWDSVFGTRQDGKEPA